MSRILLILLLLSSLCFANTPGKHYVALTWNASPTPGVISYNVYRGATSGVCSGTPTPYATGITTLTYNDTVVVEGATYFYAVTAVKGGESTCSNEVQATVPTSPLAPSNLQGSAQ